MLKEGPLGSRTPYRAGKDLRIESARPRQRYAKPWVCMGVARGKPGRPLGPAARRRDALAFWV